VALEGCGDAPVSLFLSGLAAVFGVGLDGADVGELVGQRRVEVGGGGVVVAGLADVGVGARSLRFMAGAVAVRDAGLGISLASPEILSGTIGRPTGVRVSWRGILPIASS
jgi:hypothetical protein